MFEIDHSYEILGESLNLNNYLCTKGILFFLFVTYLILLTNT